MACSLQPKLGSPEHSYHSPGARIGLNSSTFLLMAFASGANMDKYRFNWNSPIHTGQGWMNPSSAWRHHSSPNQ
jgi:hypothetical protein